MPEKINHKTIIEGSLFGPTIKELKEILGLVDTLGSNLKSHSSLPIGAIDPNSAKNIQKLLDEAKKLQDVFVQTAKLDNERLKLANKLAIAQSKEGKEQEILRQKIVKQNKENREQAKIKAGLVGLYAQESMRLIKLRTDYKNLAIAEKQNTVEGKKLLATVTRLDLALKKVDATVGQNQRHVGNYTGALGKMKGALLSAASAAGITVGAFGAFRLLRNSTDIVREFDLSMQTLSGVLRESRDDLGPLEDQIKFIGRTTIKTTNETAKLAESLATLGKTPDQIIALLSPVTNLSIGLKTTSDAAGEFLIQQINAFEGSIDEAEKYADVIATIRTSTSLDFEKMKDAFAFLSPISRILGEDIAFTGALVGILADNGLKAASSGRLLATSQQRLAKKGESLATALEKLNKAREEGIEGNELLALSADLFGAQAGKIGVVLSRNTDLIQENAQAIRDNGGALNELTTKQIKSLDGGIKLLVSAWEGYVLGVNDATSASSVMAKGLTVLAENLSAVINTLILGATAYAAYRVQVSFAAKEGFLYTVVTKAKTAAQWLNTTALRVARAAMIAFNTASKANIIGAIVVLVLAAVVAFKALSASMSNSNKELKKTIDLTDEVNNKIAEEVGEVNRLIDITKDDTKTKEQKLAAIDELNKISPEYLGTITLENSETKGTTKAVKAYTQALKEKALVQVLDEERKKIVAKQFKAEQELFKLQAKQEKEKFRSDDRLRSGGTLQAEIDFNNAIVESAKKELKDLEDASDKFLGKNKKKAGGTGDFKTQAEKDKEAAKAKKERDAALKLARDAERERELLLLLTREKEISIRTEQFEKEKAVLEKANLETFDLTFKFNQDIEDINLKFWKREVEAFQKKIDAQAKITDKANALEKKKRIAREKALAKGKKEQDKELSEANIKRKKEENDKIAKGIQALDDIAQRSTDKRINLIDNEIEASKRKVQDLKLLAAQGNKNAADSIAIAERNQLKLEKQRERRIKRQKQQEVIIGGLQTYQAKVAAGDENAVLNTAKDVGLLIGLLDSLGGFKDGTESLKAGSKTIDIGTKRDNLLIRAEEDERIVSVADNKKLGGISNSGLVDLVRMHNKGALQPVSVAAIAAPQMDLNKLLDETKTLNKSIERLPHDIAEAMPDKEIDYNVLTNIIETRIKKGNKTVITKEKNRW